MPLPARVLPEIREQMDRVRRLHAEDLAGGPSECGMRNAECGVSGGVDRGTNWRQHLAVVVFARAAFRAICLATSIFPRAEFGFGKS